MDNNLSPDTARNYLSQAPELLADLASRSALIIIDMLGTDKTRAEDVAREITEEVASVWGGQIIYMPRDISSRRAKRDRALYDDYIAGVPHQDLVRIYQVSLPWVYRIIKTERRREIARKQRALFDDDQESS